MPYIELLAPARDATTGIAAINCGADAVYIGAGKFSARQAAGNEMAEIGRIVNYAHLYRAKVYLALNTIIRDDELEEAVRLIHQAWNAGIDGLIVQDMGLLECALPPVPLIASTQTDNRTPEQVKFLEQSGFGRVILARELSLNEISKIHEASNIELEFFVHGALCVSYSGRCYFSQAITGRSANRGACVQPCRSAYDLVDEAGNILIRNKHLLSLKDLNLSAYLRELIDAGISSFKIEGRLKDSAYVKNVTAFYRQKLDVILSSDKRLLKPSSGSCHIDFDPDPDRTFNRGYTSHFVRGRQMRLSSFLSQKSLGKEIGRVIRMEGDYIHVETTEPIVNGDGLCYMDGRGELQGFQVNGSNTGQILPNEKKKLAPGTILYRNLDHTFTRILSKQGCTRRIEVDLRLADTEQGFCLQALDEDGYTAESTITAKKEAAGNPEKMMQSAEGQLKKTGDTPFIIRKLDIQWHQPMFLPISLMNTLRRDALNLLEMRRREGYVRPHRKQGDGIVLYPVRTLSYQSNILNSTAASFYAKRGVEHIEPAFEKIQPEQDIVLMTTRYCLKYELGACPLKQMAGDNQSFNMQLYLQDRNHRYKLNFDCKNCQMQVLLDQ